MGLMFLLWRRRKRAAAGTGDRESGSVVPALLGKVDGGERAELDGQRRPRSELPPNSMTPPPSGRVADGAGRTASKEKGAVSKEATTEMLEAPETEIAGGDGGVNSGEREREERVVLELP